MADYSMANRRIAYALGRGRAYISDMSSTSGYMGAKYVQDVGLRFFRMSSTSGNMGATYFQEFVPDVRRVMFQILRVMACQYPACQ